MNEQESARIILLKDEKGVYGISAENLPSRWQHLTPIITRPDRVADEGGLRSALQMIPSEMFRSSAEYAFVEALTESWGAESARKLGVDRLPPKHYFALRGRCRRAVNSLLHQALAVANPEYLRTARRYSIELRLSIYNACCLYGERINQISNIFPVAAALAYGYDIDRDISAIYRAAARARRAEIRELIQKGARLGVVADALKIPKIARHIWPANVSLVPWDVLKVKPECLFYMPRSLDKQRRWLRGLRVASEFVKWSPEFPQWVSRHAAELSGPREVMLARLRDLGDWLRACNDKTNRLELEKLNADLEALIEKAQALGKDTTWMRSALQPHRGAEFVTRVFT